MLCISGNKDNAFPMHSLVLLNCLDPGHGMGDLFLMPGYLMPKHVHTSGLKSISDSINIGFCVM